MVYAAMLLYQNKTNSSSIQLHYIFVGGAEAEPPTPHQNPPTHPPSMDYFTVVTTVALNQGPRLLDFSMLNSSESDSTQVSVKFQLLIKHCKNLKTVLAYKLSDAVFILLINVKMSTICGILSFMSRINFMLS